MEMDFQNIDEDGIEENNKKKVFPKFNIETEDFTKFKGRLIIETPDHNTP